MIPFIFMIIFIHIYFDFILTFLRIINALNRYTVHPVCHPRLCLIWSGIVEYAAIVQSVAAPNGPTVLLIPIDKSAKEFFRFYRSFYCTNIKNVEISPPPKCGKTQLIYQSKTPYLSFPSCLNTGLSGAQSTASELSI